MLEDLWYHIKKLRNTLKVTADYQNAHSLSRFKHMYNNKLIKLMFVRLDTLLVTVDCGNFIKGLGLGKLNFINFDIRLQ